MIPSYISRLTTNFSKISTIGCKNYHDQTDEPTGPKVITDLPGPKSKALLKNVKFQQKIEKSDIFGNYEDSVGNYLVDADGNTFLDISLQDNRVPFGYNYKNLEKVLFASNKRIDEIKMGVFPGMRFPTKTAQSFQEVSPNMPGLYLCPNEAVALKESMNAMKYSSEKHDSEMKSQRLFGSIFNKKVSTKYSLLCFKDAQSLAPSNEDLSRVDYPMYKYPLNENIEYNNSEDEKSLAMIEDQICVCQEKDRPVAGIIIEPLQSTTNQVLSTKFMLKLEEIACKNGIYLMFDEMRTCCGATGRFWMHEHYPLHCQPDILSFGGKMQVSGFFHRADLFPFYNNNNLLTTESISLSKLILFENIIDLIGRHNLMKNARITGDYIKNNLLHMEKEYENLIKATRGLGTIVAFDASSPRMAEDFLRRLRQKGILCGKCGASGIAVRPSLTFTKNHAVIFIDRLLDVIKQTSLKPTDTEHVVPVLPMHDEKAVLDTISKSGKLPPSVAQSEKLADSTGCLKQIDGNKNELELLNTTHRDSSKVPPSLSLINEAQRALENVQTKKDKGNMSITIKLPKSLKKGKKPASKTSQGKVTSESIKKQKLDIQYPKKPSGQKCKSAGTSAEPPRASSAPMRAMPKAPPSGGGGSKCGKTSKDKCKPSAQAFKIKCLKCMKKGSGKCKPGKNAITIKCSKCKEKGGGQCAPGKNAITIKCMKCKENEGKGCQPTTGAITIVCAACKKEQQSNCNGQSRNLSYLVYRKSFYHAKRFYTTKSTDLKQSTRKLIKSSSRAEKNADRNCSKRHRSCVRNKYKLNKLDIDHYKISGRKFFALNKSNVLLKQEPKAIMAQRRNRDTDAIYDDANATGKKDEKKDEKKDDKSPKVKALALKWIKKRNPDEGPQLEVLYCKETNQKSDGTKDKPLPNKKIDKPLKEIKTPEVKKNEPVKAKETPKSPNLTLKNNNQNNTNKVTMVLKGNKKICKKPSGKIKKEGRVSSITSSSLEDSKIEEKFNMPVAPLVEVKPEGNEAKTLRELNLGSKQTNQNQSDLPTKLPDIKANEKLDKAENDTKVDKAKPEVTKNNPNQLIEKPVILTDAPQVTEKDLETKEILKAKQAFNEEIEALFKAKPPPSSDPKKQKDKKGGDKGKKKVQITTKKKVPEKCKKVVKKAKKGKAGGSGPCAPQTCPKVMELVFFMKSKKGILCPKICNTKKVRTRYQVLKSKRKCKGSWQTDCF